MNILDIIIIATVLYLILKGIFRGFIREVASLAGIILGIWIGSHFQPQMTSYLRSHLPGFYLIPLISFGLIFASVLLSCNLIGWTLRLIVKKAFLGGVDRALGAGFALIKGIIIMYLAMVLLTFFLPAKTPLISGSRLAPLIIVSYQSMIRFISPEHYRNLKERLAGNKNEKGETESEKTENPAK